MRQNTLDKMRLFGYNIIIIRAFLQDDVIIESGGKLRPPEKLRYSETRFFQNELLRTLAMAFDKGFKKVEGSTL